MSSINNSAGSNRTSSKKNWQGLGGPIRVERPDYNRLVDPTLDSCCQREQESHARQSALKQTLQRYGDVVAERERRRRHLVPTTGGGAAFGGGAGLWCRCCHDPAQDGTTTSDYRALAKLRAERQQQDEQHYNDSNENAVFEQENEKQEKEAGAEKGSDDSDGEFDYLLDGDDDLQSESQQQPTTTSLKLLEEQRRRELEWELLRREVGRQHGFGAHRPLHPARVWRAAGLLNTTATNRDDTNRPPVVPAAVVWHLVDPDSRASASLDLCLERLALKYGGTQFVRSGGRATLLANAELAARALPSPRLRPDRDLPALVAIRDGVTVHSCPRLQGLTEYFSGGGVDSKNNNSEAAEVVESAVEDWLHRSGVLLEQPPRLEAICRIRPEEEALLDSFMTTTTTKAHDAEQAPRFDCGMPHCCKSFPHEHVGEKTEQQDGLVVSEQEIVGDGAAL